MSLLQKEENEFKTKETNELSQSQTTISKLNKQIEDEQHKGKILAEQLKNTQDN